MSMTITEALADIKTSVSRIQKKREQINQFIGRDSRLRDPHEAAGGSREFIRREQQAIKDLEDKIVNIRVAIQQKNLTTMIEIEGESHSVAWWLNWRREVAQGRRQFLAHQGSQVANLRTQATRLGQGVVVAVANANTAPSEKGDLIVNVDETALAAEVDRMERILGTLDGRLSLVNATTTVEV